jgi:hypothetical protein
VIQTLNRQAGRSGIISPAERESLLCSLARISGQGNVASSGLRLKGKPLVSGNIAKDLRRALIHSEMPSLS